MTGISPPYPIPEAGIGDDAVTEAKIKDGEIINADIAAAAAIAYSKLATDPRIARIKTGTYTGDGTLLHPITGIGFRPKYVFIIPYCESDDPAELNMKIDWMFGTLSFNISDASYYFNRIISLDADGFTVDDNGADEDPNADGQVYGYVAWG